MSRPMKTALHQAILDHRIHQVRLLVRQFPHVLNIRDVYGQTPLTVACRLEDEVVSNRIAKMLISSGCEVDILDNNQRSALSYAAQKGRSETVRRILKRDACMDLAESDRDGNTPLHLAAEAGQPDVVEILIDEFFKCHLNIDHPNNDGFTPLLLACKNDNYVSAYSLLTKGKASPDSKDTNHELDALEWIQKADKQMFPHIGGNHNRAQTALYQPAKRSETFFRNRIMYGRSYTPVCHHASVEMSLSMNPAKDAYRFMKENVLEDGADARKAVLGEIVRASQQIRPVSTRSCKTARLFKVSDKKRRGKRCIGAVINTLFQIYSEQQLTKEGLKSTVPVPPHHKARNSLNSQASQSTPLQPGLPIIEIT